MPTSFIQIRFSCNQNIEEALTQTKKNPLSNVYTGKSNLDERSGQLNRGQNIEIRSKLNTVVPRSYATPS